MKVIYARISTIEQNEDRQLEKGVLSFIDKCSGTIPFMDRPQAKKLINHLKNNKDSELHIKAVDRLGRNLLDILHTVKYFKENNIKLHIENLGMNSESPFFEMMVSLLGTIAEQEKKTIQERCKQGIEIAKAKGEYKGRKPGTKDNREKTLLKHNDIVMCLNKNMKIQEIAKVTNKARATIYKVKAII